MLRSTFLRALLALFLTASLAVPVLPQTRVELPDIAGQLQAALSPIAQRVDEIDRQLQSGSLQESDLNTLRAELEKTAGGVLERVVALQPDLIALDRRIARLPPPPGEGQPEEPEEIAEERKALAAAKAKTTLAVREAEQLSVRARNLISTALEARRQLFVGALLRRRTLDREVFTTVRDGFSEQAATVWNTVSAWIVSEVRFNQWRLAGAFILTGVVWFMLHLLLRPMRRWLSRMNEADDITYLQRITFAFFTIVLPGAAVSVMALTLHQVAGYFGLYRLRIDQIVPAFLTVLAGWVFVWLLLRAVLSPARPKRRLLTMTDRAARRLLWLGMTMAVIYGLDYFAEQLITIFSMPVPFTIVKSLVATLLIALVLVLVVSTRLNPLEESQRSGYRGWYPPVYWLVWVSIATIVIAEIAGFVALGRFIAGQIIITGSIVATMYIGFLASRAISQPGAMASTSIGAIMSERGTSELRLDQLGLLTSAIINIAVVLIGLPVLLLQWGFDSDEMSGWAQNALFGFTIGGYTISVGRILVALAIFLALIAATRAIQRWFENKVLSRTQLDSGVRNSVKAGVGYIGFFIAALVGISWAGFNLSNLALIAGALSVGIGFGLQNIVNNFVSGIIMLVERPIKVGDIISVAGSDGFVRKINVRATELETFDRQSVIIPNSEVINTSVGNWMHIDSVRRIVIAVGVAYGSDTEKVRDLLLETVKGDSRVATFPPPFVYFADFGASSLDFQLRFFIRDIMETPFVETDVRFRIDKAFRENEVEIPFPQTDLHIRTGALDVTEN